MKLLYKKRIMGLFLSFILVLGSMTTAFADITPSVEIKEIKTIVYSLLESIYQERDMYGLGETNFNNLYLGEKIQAYQDENNELKKLSIDYYPIIEDNSVIAIASVTYDDKGNPLVQLGKRFSNKLQAFIENKSESVALIFDETGENLYVCDEEKNYDYIDNFISRPETTKSTYLNNSQIETKKLFDILNMEDIEFTEIKPLIELNVNQATEAQEIAPNNSNSLNDKTLARTNKDSKYLNVPIVLQGNYNLCWAASAASVGNYKTGKNYTAKNIAKKIGVGYNEGGSITDAKKALKDVYSITTHKKYYAPSFTTIMEQIQDYNPIWSGFGADNGSLGHAVVLRGYGTSSQGAALSYMDPNEDYYEIMSVYKDGVYQFAYGSITYTCECYLEI